MRRCRSVNYMEKFLLCELNYKNTTNKDANVTVTSNVVYSERIHWNENEVNRILNHLNKQRA
ncbi:hypothetical protein FSP39_020826 [Pinctada imbricata]|uniref:Uncharacterized protein n=1 Tax=Pinctada imbricata TaxID=66713 RepID=A0AA88YVC9_PINIB|nr:hypothetical protein FSP39_020826 [Pinctada imbricata]